MPTPTFLRDLVSDVLNGRTSPISAILALRLVEQAEALEGGLAKKEGLFWSKSQLGYLLLGHESCTTCDSYYTATPSTAYAYRESGGAVRRGNAGSLEEAAELVYGWAIEDGYDVAPCPVDLLPPKKVTLVWVEHGGWHLCLPGDLNYMNAPYSYWASPVDIAHSYDDLGAKSRRQIDTQSEEAGIKLIVEWATADGYEVPPFPVKAAPVSKDEADRLIATYTLLKKLRALDPCACYGIKVYGDGSGVLFISAWTVGLDDSARVIRQEIDRVKAAKS